MKMDKKKFGKKRNSKAEKRTKVVQVRMNDFEYSELKKVAEKTEMNFAELLRNQFFSKKIVNKKIEIKKIAEINRIGNNLNQIAHFCNTYKSDVDCIEILKSLLEIERAVKEVLKKC